MGYNRPETSSEINIRLIKKLLKHVKIQKITKKEATSELNRRFDRLEKENIGMFEEMYPKFIKQFK